ECSRHAGAAGSSCAYPPRAKRQFESHRAVEWHAAFCEPYREPHSAVSRTGGHMSTHRRLGFGQRWVFSTPAIHPPGDPPLKAGVHLRILTSRALGIPIAPFIVYRLSLGAGAKAFTSTQDVVWVDSKGAPLLPPFAVTPDNPVRAFFPPSNRGVCVWLEIDAVPALPEGLRVEAQVNTGRGPAVIAALAKPPYQLGATPIESVRISGRGTVQGLHWVDARSLKPFAGGAPPWRALGLPVVAAKRYCGLV